MSYIGLKFNHFGIIIQYFKLFKSSISIQSSHDQNINLINLFQDNRFIFNTTFHKLSFIYNQSII